MGGGGVGGWGEEWVGGGDGGWRRGNSFIIIQKINSQA